MKYEIQIAEYDCFEAYIKDNNIELPTYNKIIVNEDGFDYAAILINSIKWLDIEELAEYTSFKITII